MNQTQKLKISAITLTSALGAGMEAHYQALSQHKGGLRRCDFEGVDLETWIGRVDGLEFALVTGELADYDCRNNRLAQMGLQQDGFIDSVANAVQRYGSARIGVFLGTSTSGVEQTEQAYASRNEQGELPSNFIYQTTQNTFSVADYTRHALGLDGVAHVVSTACSSSAKAFATAQRFMKAGLCDAAVVGGVDSLCQMTLYGFNALQLVSNQPCRPADSERDGINIGEAAGFALVEWSDDAADMCVLGYGESSDAYHMSTPHPDGDGALAAMEEALHRAQLTRDDIDYINLHGTATPANDRSEDQAVYRLFNGQVPCSSTKGFTGHTLGAAGIVEAGFACLAIEKGFMPGSLNTQTLDENLRSQIITEPKQQAPKRVMSNSFGFGGSNACLIIGRPGQ
ncbi:beta-ketoacyl-[acyl-carrier-protein] synthase family protein [Pseudomonadota bacterium]